MKIELYSAPNDIHAKAIKLFLSNNNIKFHETATDDIRLLENVTRRKLPDKISILKITKNHGIEVIEGFSEQFLNQLVEHIEKYNPKIT
nr:hypothetical protein [uncultured archaeon]